MTVKDEPSPTLPEALRVDKLVSPVTFKPFKAPKPVILPPTPMLPVVVKDEPEITPRSEVPATLIPERKLAAEVTFRDDPTPTVLENIEIPVTFNDPPTPTLPVVTKDPPTPKLPEKNPAPVTWKLNEGVEVPTPTLPLSKTVKPRLTAFVP